MRFAHIFCIATLLVLLPALAFGGDDEDRDRRARGWDRSSNVRRTEAPSRDSGRSAPGRSGPSRSSGSPESRRPEPVRSSPDRPSPVRSAPERSSPVRESRPETPRASSPARSAPFLRPGPERASPPAETRPSSPARSDPSPRRDSGGSRGPSALPFIRSNDRSDTGFRRPDAEPRSERPLEPTRSSPVRRVPTTTDRGPPAPTADRIPLPTDRDRGSRDRGGFTRDGRDGDRHGDRTGASPRDGFYRPSGRRESAPVRVDRDRWDGDRRHDGDRYRYSHRTVHRPARDVVVVHHYDRGWNWRGYYGYYVGFSWNWYFGYGSLGLGWGRYAWPCWYDAPVCVAYVPFGFYLDRDPVLVREIIVEREVPVYVDREVPVVVVEREGAVVKTSEYEEPAAEAGEDIAPPPTFDATTEKYLREGSEAFAKADYEAAAKAFRMAVIANPENAGPKFAFGQALLALGDYPYASRVLREALAAEPEILNAPGSLVGVYRDPEEFYRVFSELRTAQLERKTDPDLLFLVLYQHYFSGDPQAIVSLDRLREAWPEDPMAALFAPAMAERFPEFSKFPEPKTGQK